MKKRFRLDGRMNRVWILFVLGVCCLLSAGCAGDEREYGSGEISVQVDRSEVLLYEDSSTEIVYTVTTPEDCASVSIRQIYTGMDYEDSLEAMGVSTKEEADRIDPEVCNRVLNEKTFARTDPGVQVHNANGVSVWTLPCDFGFNGVDGVLIAAQMPFRDYGYKLYAFADVHVRYPEISVEDGYQSLLIEYIRHNKSDNAPFYFVIRQPETEGGLDAGTELMREEYALWSGKDASFTTQYRMQYGEEPENPWTLIERRGTIVYNDVFFDGIQLDARQIFSASTETSFDYGALRMTGMLVPSGWVLGCIYIPDEAYVSCREGGGGVRISDSSRAAAAYAYGIELSPERYPEAAFLLERGSAVLQQVLRAGMTDFEKERAIFSWLVASGQTFSDTPEVQALPVSEQDYYYKTAYGILSGVGGDCMAWSDAYYMLCNMAGVPCTCVPCSAQSCGRVSLEDGGYQADHRLNAVLLDGEWYYCDVFWSGAGSGYDALPYAYMNMTSAEAEENYCFPAVEDWGPPESAAVAYAVDDETGELLAAS